MLLRPQFTQIAAEVEARVTEWRTVSSDGGSLLASFSNVLARLVILQSPERSLGVLDSVEDAKGLLIQKHVEKIEKIFAALHATLCTSLHFISVLSSFITVFSIYPYLPRMKLRGISDAISQQRNALQSLLSKFNLSGPELRVASKSHLILIYNIFILL